MVSHKGPQDSLVRASTMHATRFEAHRYIVARAANVTPFRWPADSSRALEVSSNCP